MLTHGYYRPSYFYEQKRKSPLANWRKAVNAGD